MLKKKVIISACLLGEMCRYDGKTKQDDELLKKFNRCEIIPFCPEAPVFGTPRERINVVEIDSSKKIFTDKTLKDVTKLLEEEINSFIDKNQDIDMIVLKSKSPSCGIGTTPIYDKDKNTIRYGDGIAASIFKNRYQKVPMVDEKRVFNYN